MRGRCKVSGRFRRLAPLLPLLVALWCGYDAVLAVQQGRTGAAVWEGAKMLIFLVVTYLMNDFGKRIPDA